jgi:tetratricopeptide (TPR) repeat protein
MAGLLTVSMAMAQDKSTAPQQQQQKGQAAQQPAGQAAPAPNVKQTKSKEEFAAYNAAVALTDPAAVEAAANDFVTKYPESELRGELYRRAMGLYGQSGNTEKVVENGRKALTYLPDDAATLVVMASEIAEHTRETDLDRDERLADVTKYANHALETVDKIVAPPAMSPEQFAQAKAQLRADAYSALGMAGFVKKDYATAEKNFKSALQAVPNDDYIMLRLTIALDKQNKYAEGLEWANKTIAASKPGSQVQQLANQEKTRLTTMANAPAKPAPAPGAPQPQTVTPK